MEQQSFISEAAMVASAIAGTGSHRERAVSLLVSMRLPVHLLIRIDAMAKHSNRTRTSVVSMLLSVGLDAVEEHFSPATREALQPLYVDAAAALLPAGDALTEGDF